MTLSVLRAENFRCLAQVELAAGPRLNFIAGPNGSGKTSLLEALHVLGRGKSFRGSLPAEWAGRAGRHWRIAAAVARDPALPAAQARIAWDGESIDSRWDGESATRSEMAERFAVQLIDVSQHRLLEDGPGYRRRYLDWGVFHVEQNFYEAWRRYQRALAQRNRALKVDPRAEVVSAFDAELATAGEEITRHRIAYVEDLAQRVPQRVAHLLAISDWKLQFERGWPAERSLAEALAAGLERDRALGQTASGPHRAELRMRLGGAGVRNRASRGQQKMLIAALVLAQAEGVRERTGRDVALLVDDFGSELDTTHQARLREALAGYPGQVFVTGTAVPGDWPAASALFHVEQGSLEAAG